MKKIILIALHIFALNFVRKKGKSIMNIKNTIKNIGLFLFVLLVSIQNTNADEKLSETEKEIISYLSDTYDEQLSFLEKIVNINSGTHNHAGVREVGNVFARELEAIGFKTEWQNMPAEVNRAGHLVAKLKSTSGKCLLLLGHIDTVFRKDSPFQKFENKGDHLAGPGVADMKGGNMMILYALKAMHKYGSLNNRCISIMFTGDEEAYGYPISFSRGRMIEMGKKADYALSFEGGSNGGTSVARRADTEWQLEVSGRRAHSSQIFQEKVGAGAAFEAARILNAFYEEVKGEEHLVINPHNAAGGTELSLSDNRREMTVYGSSAVAQTYIINGTMRFITMEQLERAKKKMIEITNNNLPHTTAMISFDKVNVMPMPASEGNLALLAKLQRINDDLGIEYPVYANNPSDIGGSDIQVVAPFVDSIDGLGFTGANAHSVKEVMHLKNYHDEINRAALLIYRLSRE